MIYGAVLANLSTIVAAAFLDKGLHYFLLKYKFSMLIPIRTRLCWCLWFQCMYRSAKYVVSDVDLVITSMVVF